MSGNQPAAPQRRELEIMRVLFERRLKDRAIALADSRWPGSGKMVDLAYEWGDLEPTERRDRLSKIGPEEIARLREFAELNPELSKAVTELDRRGVLPHIEAAAVDVAAASRETREQQARAEATSPGTAAVEEPIEEVANGAASAEEIDVTPIASPGDGGALHTDMPELDLGLQSTDEFLHDEAERRQKATQAAEEAMDRVRRNLDQATQRAFQRGASMGMPKMPEISRPSLPSLETSTGTGSASRSATRAIDAPASLANHLQRHVVAMVRPGDPRPTDDQLVALANDLQIGFTEHTVSYENRKEVFGGLVSEYGRITVRPGSIARAIAAANLVVIRGRLSSQLADRIEAGFLDIPGTRASVKVHPDARVVVIGDA